MAQESFRQENKAGPNISQSGDGQNITVNINTPSQTAPPSEKDDSEEVSEGGGCGLVAAALVFAVILLIIILANGGEDEPPPGKPWPTGISRDTILQPIADKIYNCSMEAVLAPRTCPQSSSSVAQASKIRWSIHGYPTDGANIRFDGRSFIVDGTAVTSVRFRESSKNRYKVHIIPYRAVVYKDAEGLRLGSLVQVNEVSDKVNKKKLSPEWGDLKAQVRSAFDKCTSSKRAPMPPGCPQSPDVPSTDDSIWTLEADPLLNTDQSFDDNTGIIHVRGSYSIHLEGVGFWGRVNKTQSGDYDAWVAVGDSGIEVLDIRHDS
ncbi:hypothetical protein AB0J63_46340 [Streptosporangium canum]|uniref:hypothetical protein n=1 Tax=Streptosporangium canum TaxID=324952 RepID=UPI00343C5ABA